LDHLNAMVKKIIVLGGGSAGFMAAMALRKRLPMVDVLVIRSRDIGIIGVGEGSTVALTRFLHDYVKVGMKRFHEVAQPTWKLGLHFLWGPRRTCNGSRAAGPTFRRTRATTATTTSSTPTSSRP
jgi:glycine/D-amino acid oxidase-like deaminating enzyme